MNGVSSLYGDIDITQVMFGQNCRRVPCWMYVQGPGHAVSFVGGSKGGVGPDELNPLCYGSQRTHQFVIGEIIVRPRLVIGTDALRGFGLASLAMHDHGIAEMLTEGELTVGSADLLRKVLTEQEG